MSLISMKSSKLFTLDTEIVDSLKKVENASRLVNELLLDYFYSGGGQEKEEIKGNLIKLKTEVENKKGLIKNLKEKIKEIEKKDKEIKEKFKHIPIVILQDFKMFPLMSEEALLSRYNSQYFGTVEWKELLTAYKEYFKK